MTQFPTPNVSPDPAVAALMAEHRIPYRPLPEWPPWRAGNVEEAEQFFRSLAQQGYSYEQARASWDAQQQQVAATGTYQTEPSYVPGAPPAYMATAFPSWPESQFPQQTQGANGGAPPMAPAPPMGPPPMPAPREGMPPLQPGMGAPDVPGPGRNITQQELQQQEALQALAAEAARKNADEANLQAQNRQAGILMQQILTPQQQAAAPGFQGATPATAAGPVWQGDLASFTQAAMAGRDQAMAGQSPTMPGTYMPSGPPMGSPESYAAMQQPNAPPVGRPTEGRFSTMAEEFRSDENREALADAMSRLKERRGPPLPESKRRELVTAHRRGQTPSGYRADIGTASPTDIAMLAGPEAAMTHEGVLGPMLQQQQEQADLNARASVLVAALRSHGETGQPIPPALQRHAENFLSGGMGLPPSGPPPPGRGRDALPTLQSAAAAKGLTDELNKALADENGEAIENIAKRAGVSNAVTKQVVAQFTPEPGVLGRVGSAIAGEATEGMAGTLGLLGILPDVPVPHPSQWIPREQVDAMERLAEGDGPEAARAKEWVEQYWASVKKAEWVGDLYSSPTKRAQAAIQLVR